MGINLWFCLMCFCASTGTSGFILWVVLRQRKKYNSTYFKLYIYQTTVNTISWINFFFAFQLPHSTCKDCILAPFFRALPWQVTSPMAVGISYFNYLQLTNACLMTCHRWTFFYYQHEHDFIWKKPLNYGFLVITLFPLLASAHDLVTDSGFTYMDYFDGYKIASVDYQRPFYDPIIYFFYAGVVGLFLVIGHGIILFRVLRRWKYFTHRDRINELFLYWHNLAYSGVLCLFCLNASLLTYPDKHTLPDWLYSPLLQLVSLTLPVLLLVTNKKLRDDVALIFYEPATTLVYLNDAFEMRGL